MWCIQAKGVINDRQIVKLFNCQIVRQWFIILSMDSEFDKKFLKLNDIECYRIAFYLSNYVWEIVIKWEWFPKKTVGGQFVEAVDSISANIAEGFGRHFKKDKIKFFMYSKGSLKESFD